MWPKAVEGERGSLGRAAEATASLHAAAGLCAAPGAPSPNESRSAPRLRLASPSLSSLEAASIEAEDEPRRAHAPPPPPPPPPPLPPTMVLERATKRKAADRKGGSADGVGAAVSGAAARWRERVEARDGSQGEEGARGGAGGG